jgi:hypothetical protein
VCPNRLNAASRDVIFVATLGINCTVSSCVCCVIHASGLTTGSSTTSSFSARRQQRLSLSEMHLSRRAWIYSLPNLVPIGSPALFIRTHALSSNRTTLPSLRCVFAFVRTTTACLMSPLRTLFAAETVAVEPVGFEPDSGPKLRCFWTTTTIRSPIRAGLLRLKTWMHSTMAAPLLSMHWRRVCRAHCQLDHSISS